MKKLLTLSIVLSLFPTPIYSQQVTVIKECREYIENYSAGNLDPYGNYFQGNVSTQKNNVDCNTGQVYSSTPYYQNNYSQPYYPQPYSQPYSRPYSPYGYNRYTNPNCNPVRTLLGSALGGAIGRSMTSTSNNRNNRGWATVLGAAIGGLTFAC